MEEVKTKLKVGAKNSPTIEYSMGVNKDGEPGRFVIGPDQYNQTIDQGDFSGTKQIQVQSLDGVPNLWVQGTTLLEDLYSVFIYDISFNIKGELILKARNVALYNKVDGPQIIQSRNTCEEEYADSGGISGDYEDYASKTTVFKPDTKGKKVALHFDYIEIENKYDFLYVYDGLEANEANLKEKYTGKHMDEKIISTHPSGALTVKFTSDYAITKRGWKAKVDKCSIETFVNCEKEFIDSDKNENKNYENNENQHYFFIPEKGKKVVLRFDDIDIENTYDFLYVYDGLEPNEANRKKIYTGKQLDEKITSSHPSGALTVVFTSDNSVTKTGWKARVNKCKRNLSSRSSISENKQEAPKLLQSTLIYPNPLASWLYIVIPSSEKSIGDSDILITNVLGKVVGTYKYKESTNALKLDLSKLSKGTYFVKISNNKETITKKIIKE